MNETNRFIIVLAAAGWIVLMAVVIFVTWAAPNDAIDKVADFAEFLNDNDGSAGKLVVTLGAAAAAMLALLWIVVELAPEDDVKELRIEQAGATTIIPADALRLRLEEALLELPGVTAARSRVWPRDKGVSVAMDLTVTQGANVGALTQEAVRSVVDTLHTDLGLPVSGTPDVKITFGGSRVDGGAPAPAPVMPREPRRPFSPIDTADERVSEVPSASFGDPSQSGHADASPGPLVYDVTPGDEERADHPQ
ncbi:MAG: hypothetical protein WD904_01795 [Dehalococcoidia bacterium]